MDIILAGFADALTPMNILFIAFGVFTGIMVGAIPGLNGPMAIAIAVPITFYMTPLAALAFLIGINKGGTFGGSVSAVLLNTPGSPEATATAFDGYPMARQGKGQKAVKMALYSSVFGDTFSDIVLILVAAPFAIIALKMGPTELTAVLIFSFTIIAALAADSMVKGLIAAALGAFVSTVGLDIDTAMPRLTFGFLELEDGIPIIAMAIGLLALSEVLVQVEDYRRSGFAGATEEGAFGKGVPRENRVVTWAEFIGCWRTLLRSAVIGTGIGALPGIGSVIASFLGYAAAKNASKTPEEFGKGRLEGVAAAESANSAVVGANLIPLLALGIPGNLAAAMLIGAFLIHGIVPGPSVFQEHGQLIYGIFGAMLIANVLNLVIGQVGLRFFALLVSLPKTVIHPVIVVLCIVGAYVIDSGMFAVGIMFIFAVLGYIMRKIGFSFATFVIGFVLGPMFELSLRQSIILFQETPLDALTRPIVLVFLGLTLFSLWRVYVRTRRAERAAANRSVPESGAGE